jgi:hypothetical protein
MWTVLNLNIYEFKQIPNIQKKVKFVAELGRPISERLQAFARNGRLKRRIGAPLLMTPDRYDRSADRVCVHVKFILKLGSYVLTNVHFT